MAVKEISVEEVKGRLDGGQSMQLVDVRENDEWAGGHLPGATHIRKGEVEAEVPRHIADKNAPIVLYCAGGMRSAAAAEVLQRLGYTQVESMRGGIRDWQSHNFPTE